MAQLFQVAVKGVITRANHVLLLKGTLQAGPEKGCEVWDLPGGRIEEDETPHQALRREVSEELPGVQDVIVRELLMAERGYHRGDQANLIILYHRASLTFESMQLSREHSAFIWADANKLAELKHEPQKDFFDGMLVAAERALQH